MMEIVTAPDPVLRQRGGFVTDYTVARALALDMVKLAAELREPPAVGLAACQVGVPAAVFVWRMDGNQKRWYAAANPELEIVDNKLQRLEEGCLSLPGKWNVKPRARAVTMQFFDLFLEQPRSLTAFDFHARVLQHEFDHLAGKLFIDRAPKVERPPVRPRTQRKKTRRR